MDPGKEGTRPPRRRAYLLRHALALSLVTLVAGGAGVAAFKRQGGPEAISKTATPSGGVPGSAPSSPVEDTTPPEVHLRSDLTRLPPFEPLTVSGEVDEASTLRIGTVKESVDAGGFRLKLPQPPRTPARLIARDPWGNESETKLRFDIDWPPMRAVHVTGYAWATPSFRAALMQMIDKRLINTIQLDLKDESGLIYYASKLPLARRIRSSGSVYDLEDALRILHERDIRVVGRVVCFRDPILAKASWPKHKERVIQRPNGEPYSDYGGFTNLADETVRDYNIDVAEEAAAAGIDDILYDYVRRPDGPLEELEFPGLKRPPEESIVRFVAETSRHLKPYGTKLGLSVYGIAATRPRQIAQDIPRMAEPADYISPMVYPSHWGPGEYNVRDPNAQPYDIVYRSLKDFLEQTEASRTPVIPWLQDFSLGVSYGAREVRAQIRAAEDRGIDQWILWDPEVTYTASALDPIPEKERDD